MKKLFAITLAAALLLGLAACGGGGNGEIKDNEKTQEIFLVMDIGWGDGPEEYPCQGEATVEGLAAALSEKTGLVFAVTSKDDGTLTVDWSAGSSLLDGDAGEPVEGLVFYDYDGLAWFMLDSLCSTLMRNLDGVLEVYYTMDGGKELVLENLSPPVSFGAGPYMFSEFYLTDGRGDIIDEEPVDPADVNWWGEYGSEVGLLTIHNYNDRGMGWSFRFVFDNIDGETDEGVAALDPETGILAYYEKYEFRFNMDQDTITVWYDGDNAVDYVRTDDAAG